MEYNDRTRILSLPLTEAERKRKSRSWSGWSCFCSRVVADLKAMDDDDLDDLLEDNSLDGYTNSKVRFASMKWKEVNPGVKYNWKERAFRLNQQPRPGKLLTLPMGITDNIYKNVMDALSEEFFAKATKVQSSLRRKIRNERDDKSFRCGKQTIERGDRVVIQFEMNKLLYIAIFGKQNNRLKYYEVPYKSKNITIIHICSSNRCNGIFQMAGLKACETSINTDISVYCCGKMYIESSDGSIQNGYIVDSSDNLVYVKVEDNTIITMSRPIWDTNTHCYPKYSYNGYTMSEYHPIVVQISKSTGQLLMLSHKMALDISGNLFLNYCT